MVSRLPQTWTHVSQSQFPKGNQLRAENQDPRPVRSCAFLRCGKVFPPRIHLRLGCLTTFFERGGTATEITLTPVLYSLYSTELFETVWRTRRVGTPSSSNKRSRILGQIWNRVLG